MFDLLDKLRATLDRIYGEGKVTLVDASLRWMYHHSKMDGACGGTMIFLVMFSVFLVPCKTNFKAKGMSKNTLAQKKLAFCEFRYDMAE